MKTIRYQDVVQHAIDFEQAGIDFYQNYAHNFSDDKGLKELLSGFAKDEILQRWQLTSMLQFLGDEGPIQIDEKEYQRLMEMNPDDFKPYITGKELGREEMIQRAILFEKEAKAGFETMEEIFGVEKEMDQIIEVEQDHLSKIQRLQTGS